jgi:hypothetical protein
MSHSWPLDWPRTTEIFGTQDETLPAPISHSQISFGSSLPRLSLGSWSLPPLVSALSDSPSAGSVRRSRRVSGGSNAQWRRAVERTRQQQCAGCARSGSRASSPSPPLQWTRGGAHGGGQRRRRCPPLLSAHPLAKPSLSPYFSQSLVWNATAEAVLDGAGYGTMASD